MAGPDAAHPGQGRQRGPFRASLPALVTAPGLRSPQLPLLAGWGWAPFRTQQVWPGRALGSALGCFIVDPRGDAHSGLWGQRRASFHCEM